MRIIQGLLFLIGLVSAFGQPKVAVNPTITPAVFSPSETITVSYDVTGTPLASISQAWIWVWIPNKTITAKYNINPATSAADPAKFTKTVSNGKTTWSITFKPSDFFNSSIANESQMGMLIKASNWDLGQSTDYIASLGYSISIQQPSSSLVFGQAGASIAIQATSPVAANFTLQVNGTNIDAQNNLLNYSYSLILPSSPASGTIVISGVSTSGGTASTVTLDYVLGDNSPNESRPTGLRPGITYGSDPTKAYLCLQAPGKSSVYAYGDFNNWQILPDFLMKRDGEYFWIELTGLTAGQEYGFQYLVDGVLRIADPYADKILDPDDRLIPTSAYPGLKAYPSKAVFGKWYFNRVSVLQTNQPAYNWQVTNFNKPSKESLVIYELLIRDFFGSNSRTYQAVIDTLPYFKRLGINALQLMPIMEFNGNESWGYNPTFMLAPDKYYGPKNKLKELVDRCHANGIAVILDIALNHQDLPNPMAMLEFDFAAMKPTANNKWFNVTARHPFNVFFDMNHESAYTKAYLDSITHYWIDQYKVDGYRFDLSKGFTQTNNPDNVGAWGEYDASRVTILKRMSDAIWAHTPDAYVILEHLAVNTEEKALADYRASEGKGMMLWGKMTDSYNETTMGYGSSSAIAGVNHTVRGFQAPRLVGYMESHDEERLMFKNITYGNQNDFYDTRDLPTALQRVEAVSNFFYLVPGPKMLWQFGELGFELSINTCDNGTVNPPGAEGGDGDCRLSNKPPVWEYKEDYYRSALFNQTADLIRLKKTYGLFQDGTANFQSDGLVKQLLIRSKQYSDTPTDPSRMSVVIAGNFNLTRTNVSISFPHSGTWYEYYSGNSVSVSGSLSAELEPGTVKMYSDVPLAYPLITDIDNAEKDWLQVSPNPAQQFVRFNHSAESVQLITAIGTRIQLSRLDEFTWDVRQIPNGFYVGKALVDGKWMPFRLIRH